uniref:Insulinase family protein n=1 Tax=Eiseniibacteriota bacterium TaxID=2212470 RepID=A0A832I4J7_UNCEI
MSARRGSARRAAPGARAVFALALGLSLAAAPAVAAAARLTLPAATRATLKNGLRVVIVPSARLPLVDLRLVVPAGAAYDPPGREGLAGLTADLLTEGAGARDAAAFAEAIAFVGGSFAATAGPEALTLSCEVLARDASLGIELLRDAVVAPTFAPDAFERRRAEALGRIASERDDLWALADRAMLPFVYGAHPLGHATSGGEASVRALTRDDVVAFHARHVTPAGAVLVVVGAVEPRAMLAELERAFGAWKAPGAPPPAVPPLPRAGGARGVRLVAAPEATQAQIRLGCPGVPRGHPDEFAVRVANAILGDGFTSRLVNEIRVVRGLTYRIRSAFTMHRTAGAFVISTFTRNATLRDAVDEIRNVVRTLVQEGPTEAELEKAKRFLTGQFPLGLQAPDDLAAHIADVEFHGLDPAWIESFDAHVAAVTMADVRRALKSYVCTDDLALLVVADPDSARAALAGFGPVEQVGAP